MYRDADDQVMYEEYKRREKLQEMVLHGTFLPWLHRAASGSAFAKENEYVKPPFHDHARYFANSFQGRRRVVVIHPYLTSVANEAGVSPEDDEAKILEVAKRISEELPLSTD